MWLGVCGGLGLGWRGEQKPAPRRQHGEGVSAQGELLRDGAGGRQRLRVRATGVGWAAEAVAGVVRCLQGGEQLGASGRRLGVCARGSPADGLRREG